MLFCFQRNLDLVPFGCPVILSESDFARRKTPGTEFDSQLGGKFKSHFIFKAHGADVQPLHKMECCCSTISEHSDAPTRLVDEPVCSGKERPAGTSGDAFEKHDEHWVGPRVESRNRGRGLADVEHGGKLADLGQELY